MAHFLNDLRPWLLSSGLVALVGAGAWLQSQLRVRELGSENREVHAILAGPRSYRGMMAAAVALLSLAGFGLYTLPHLPFPRPGWRLPRRYQAEGRDSTRWLGFPFRTATS